MTTRRAFKRMLKDIAKDTDFQRLLDVERDAIERLDKTFAPLIGYDISSGINVRKRLGRSVDRDHIDYYYDTLNPKSPVYDPDTPKHFLQIYDKMYNELEKFGRPKLTLECSLNLINRKTNYKLRKGWRAERYYSIDGLELTTEAELKDVFDRGETVIGASVQTQLTIEPSAPEVVKPACQALVESANLYKVSQASGLWLRRPSLQRKDKRLTNRQAAINAWQIPVITYAGPVSLGEAFPRVHEIIIELGNLEASTFVGKKVQELQLALERLGIDAKLNPQQVRANRVFKRWIDRGYYSKRYRDFLAQLDRRG